MCETAAASCHRHDTSDLAWNILAPKLPGGPGKAGRPAQDNRRCINAVFRVPRTGAPWRDLPPDYGDGCATHPRFSHWRQKSSGPIEAGKFIRGATAHAASVADLDRELRNRSDVTGTASHSLPDNDQNGKQKARTMPRRNATRV